MYEEFPVNSLLLDEDNPRLRSSAESQRDAINAVLNELGEKVIRLAQDIVEIGETNPAELPIVVWENGNPVVIEGNRRIVALKLLHNPALADDQKLRKRFEKLSKAGSFPSSTYTYVAESRERARHWIRLRHTGENRGVGVVPWDAWQQNRFERKRGSQADRASIFLRDVAATFGDDAELVAATEAVRDERLTTLGRLISDPYVRQSIGIEIQDDRIYWYYPKQEAMHAVRRLLSDLAGDRSVSSIKSKEQRLSYIQEIRDDLPDPSKRLTQPLPSTTSSEHLPKAGEIVGTSRKQVARRRLQERRIFQDLRLHKVGRRTAHLLAQAQKLDIDATPAVAGVLLRVIVELVVTEYVCSHGIAKESESLARKIRVALTHLDPRIESKSRAGANQIVRSIWDLTQSAGTSSINLLNAYIHNGFADATPMDVRGLSSSYRPFLELLDAQIADGHK